jgi:type II secretory pathway predicted ATPase ExeA
MYLEHFGLKQPPFKITPVTDFFFPGANRAEILEALQYAITESEGIIKVTGEVGSGKTMLCRMLLERLPAQVEAVYLANPSLTREEMLYAIADGLHLNLEGQRVNIILQTLQNHLELKLTQGKRVVILVDEAHAMPLDTMEELRLLYNLQVGNHKLLHIVLFGQPELNDKLSQPNMRQLKDRIVHHFAILPLSQNIIESYLLFRMRTAGYRGPNPFSRAAADLIGKASQGLMRRVNILADKSLLAAFVENTHSIELRHVQAAIRDSELSPPAQAWWPNKNTAIIGGIALSAAILIGAAGWLLGNMQTNKPGEADVKPLTRPVPKLEPVTPPPAATQLPGTAQSAKPSPAQAPGAHATLLEQRIAAAQIMLAKSAAGSASIQLYYTNDLNLSRIEGFLKRAANLGKLHEIYVLSVKIKERAGFRVLYGTYSSSEEARSAMQQLPPRYQEAFTPTIYQLEKSPVS